MKFSEYERRATPHGDDMGYPGCGTGSDDALAYTMLGMGGEAGEAQGKVKKLLRGDHPRTSDVERAIVDELGDVLWYITAAAREMGYSLDEVAALNLWKVERRRREGTTQGDGDNR